MKVSVCVQTYNHERYIEKCINSILNQQTTFDFEIILGEDDSTDKTRELCKQLSENDSRINLQLNSRNDVIYIKGKPTGLYNLMNNLSLAKGEYIAICEGDDYWCDPLKLQKQVDFLDNNTDFNICFHPVKVLIQYENKLIEDKITPKVNEVTSILDLAKGNYIHTPSVMFRSTKLTLPNWFKSVPIGDWPLYMIAIRNGKIKKLKDVMAVYRVHSQGVWSSLSQKSRNKGTIHTIKIVRRKMDLPTSVRSILDYRVKKFYYATNPIYRMMVNLKIKLGK